MKKVLFVCVENACRSQIAEAWFNHLADPGRMTASSAGSAPGKEVNPNAIKVMAEVGISLEGNKPKSLTPEMNNEYDQIITMGCIDKCPITPKEKTVNWEIEDPKGQPIEKFREVRDIIKGKVEALIRELESL